MLESVRSPPGSHWKKILAQAGFSVTWIRLMLRLGPCVMVLERERERETEKALTHLIKLSKM